jgi:tRNA U34 5-carboxymethylaminomethyl modifying GTPase MnmE/TrmE
MAGLRDRAGDIETLGIERAREEIAAADFVVFLLDGSAPYGETDREAFHFVRDQSHAIVINKNKHF